MPHKMSRPVGAAFLPSPALSGRSAAFSVYVPKYDPVAADSCVCEATISAGPGHRIAYDDPAGAAFVEGCG